MTYSYEHNITNYANRFLYTEVENKTKKKKKKKQFIIS
jgi:hypothetical protein